MFFAFRFRPNAEPFSILFKGAIVILGGGGELKFQANSGGGGVNALWAKFQGGNTILVFNFYSIFINKFSKNFLGGPM
jgi:hypothetical protein